MLTKEDLRKVKSRLEYLKTSSDRFEENGDCEMADYMWAKYIAINEMLVMLGNEVIKIGE